jgi:hypothetical protein
MRARAGAAVAGPVMWRRLWGTRRPAASPSACHATAADSRRYPGLLLLRLAGRRAGVAGTWLVVAAGMAAMLAGINGGRIQGLILPPFSLAGGCDWDG